jgi:hypothetical protein
MQDRVNGSILSGGVLPQCGGECVQVAGGISVASEGALIVGGDQSVPLGSCCLVRWCLCGVSVASA